MLDFLINDIADSSVQEACHLEKEYDKNRLEGLVFCAYELNNLFKASTTEMIEMFDIHDQVFILNNDQIYKLHLNIMECNIANIHQNFIKVIMISQNS